MKVNAIEVKRSAAYVSRFSTAEAFINLEDDS